MKRKKDKGCGSGSAGQPATAPVLGKRLASVVDADQEQQLDALWLDRAGDTESESDDSQPRASSSLDRLPGGASSSVERLSQAEAIKQFTKVRVASRLAEMNRMDEVATEEAAEMGLLMPRTLEALKSLPAGPLQMGDVLTCRQEVFVKMAEYNELAKVTFTTRHGQKRGHKKNDRGHALTIVATCGDGARGATCQHMIKVHSLDSVCI